jgi:hypothetical protein
MAGTPSMHELSVTKSIISIATEHARRAGTKKLLELLREYLGIESGMDYSREVTWGKSTMLDKQVNRHIILARYAMR